MDIAMHSLKKTGKQDNHYKDDKYVKTACGIAYNCVLKALDGYVILKEVVKPKGRKSIEYYIDNIAKLDKKLLADVNSAYQVLHLSGYYDSVTYVPTIQSGFDLANNIIKRIEQ